MHWLSLKELLSWNPLNIKTDRFVPQKIRFDNAFRFWVSTSSLLVIFGLYAAGVLPSFYPVLGVFIVYGLLQFGAFWTLRMVKRARIVDFVVCGIDMVALSVAVYWTGGASSPLYFIYFVPLIIQAFHRDWVLILYYGFGGVFLYSLAVVASVPDWTPTHLLDLGARLFFMLMTVSIAALAVNLLRKRDENERVRFSRMKFLTQVSETFGHVNSFNELPAAITELVRQLNEELGPQLGSWSRVFLKNSDSQFLNAHADPSNDRPELARELASASCPAMAKVKTFRLDNAVTDEACPTEAFAFGSHLCQPIAGSDGEAHGVLYTGSIAPNAFKEEETKFLEFIASTIGLCVQRLNRVQDLDIATEMNSCAVAAFMGSTHGLNATYAAILDGVSRIAQTEQAGLMLWDAEAAMMKTVLLRGQFAGQEHKHTCQMGENVVGKSLESGKPIFETEMGENILPFIGPVTYKSWLVLPLRTIQGQPLGVISIWSDEAKRLPSRRFDMALTYATRAAIALENALARERLKKEGQNGLEKAA